MKTAYVFPGQGSQFPGMAKDLYENSEIARGLLDRANDILGFRITDIMFNGTADELKRTDVTQPAIEKSMAMMKGKKMKLFLLVLSFIGWILLSIITLGIGLLWVCPYMYQSMAAFYEDLKEETPVV